MRLFLLAAIILLVFALIVATGTAFVTGWNVWLCGGILAVLLDKAIGDRFTT